MKRLLGSLIVTCGWACAEDVGPVPSEDPGSVTIRRLNRDEYDRTVADVFETVQRPARAFPVDDIGHGFDNIGDVLNISPILAELYEQAAWSLASEATVTSSAVAVQAESMEHDGGSAHGAWGWKLWSKDPIGFVHPFARHGAATVSIRAQALGPTRLDLAVSVDGEPRQRWSWAPSNTPTIQSFDLEVGEGNRRIDVHVVEPHFDDAFGAYASIAIDWIRVEEHHHDHRQGRTRRLVSDSPRQTIAAFLRRTFRRPPTALQLRRFDELFAGRLAYGDTKAQAMSAVVAAALLSPHFIFRPEIDVDSAARFLDDYELATRLSYFLWSTTPDEGLLELAQRGALTDDARRPGVVQGMLDDERAGALADRFLSQWLRLRALDEVQRDPTSFPDFDPALRRSMRLETEALFDHFLENDRDLREMLVANFTFVDERLATHYEMAPVESSGLVRRSTAGTPRRGLLTHASVLTVTAHPRRTSPVQRGQWVLQRLMCITPAPPPPGVEGLTDDNGEPDGRTTRDRLAEHRANPTCATCHGLMDPIGLAFEHFDAIGAYRTDEDGLEIDSSGTLFDGTTFDGASSLAQSLAERTAVLDCMIRHLLIYALGRGLTGSDDRQIERIVERTTRDGGSLASAIVHVVDSELFRARRADREEVE